MKKKLIIIGGGAAGFFAAANLARENLDISILEATDEVMRKIIISGGGRCNVTHACFDPKELVTFYPRGNKELLSPFMKYACGDTMDWFNKRGVELKIEEDGRIFPITDDSKTISNCLYKNSIDRGVKLHKKTKVDQIEYLGENQFRIHTNQGIQEADYVLIATGSNVSMWKVLNEMGIKTIEPVPSLFTFNTKDHRLRELSGLAFEHVSLRITQTKLESEGPMLITHWGLSGPAILRLSAWGAVQLADMKYTFELNVQFVDEEVDAVVKSLHEYKLAHPKRSIAGNPQFNIPKRYWNNICTFHKIPEERIWADATKQEMLAIAQELTQAKFNIFGKSTHKDEFVTAGGVALEEIDFKSYEHKRFKGMYFAGEVLNIDGITGGFNFQNAWTGATIASQNILSKL